MSLYFDYNASSPCDPRVLEQMLPFFTEKYANSGSTVHKAGRVVQKAVDKARAQVADLLGAFPAEVVFTSGATESNNLAVLGAVRAHTGKRRRVLTSALEHKSILALERPLNREGYVLEVLPVDSAGRVAPEVLKSRLRDDVLLVSIQAANNEVGTLQRVAELADAAHAAGALFHTDATQWIGKLPVDVASWDVDFLSLSAHKFYGPKGVGALFVQGGVSAQPLEPLIYGGGQEWALRSGTHNVPGIVGMGHAAELTATELFEESKRLGSLRDELEKGLRRDLPEVRVNGWLEERLPHCSSLTFPGVDSEALIVQLKDFALSNGAACQSGTIEPSHVLLALGMSRSEAYNTLRVSVGRDTTLADVSALRAAVFACVSDFNKT